jgi:hypothetical protein
MKQLNHSYSNCLFQSSVTVKQARIIHEPRHRAAMTSVVFSRGFPSCAVTLTFAERARLWYIGFR